MLSDRINAEHAGKTCEQTRSALSDRVGQLAHSKSRNQIAAGVNYDNVQGDRRGSNGGGDTIDEDCMERCVVAKEQNYGNEDRWQKEHGPMTNQSNCSGHHTQ